MEQTVLHVQKVKYCRRKLIYNSANTKIWRPELESELISYELITGFRNGINQKIVFSTEWISFWRIVPSNNYV